MCPKPIDSDVIRQKYLGLRRPQVEGFIIHATGVPIGYAQWHQTGEHEGSIDLFLVSEMRGRGYGSDAIKKRWRFLTQAEGWKRITADPEQANVSAQSFWRKFGFVESEQITMEGNPVLIFDGSPH